MSRAGVALALLLLGFTGRRADAVCPASDVYLLGPATFPVEAAALDTTLTEGDWVTAHAEFDVVAGTLGAIHGELYPGQTAVTVHDEFGLVGVPVGTPLVVTAELVVDGTITTTGCGGSGCGGAFFASITANGEFAEAVEGGIMFAPETRPVHLAPRLAIPFVAGTPVPIAFHVRGTRGPGGNHRAEGAGTYRFVDLPPGVSVVSCRGFVQAPTPAPAASWGRVKAAYHR